MSNNDVMNMVNYVPSGDSSSDFRGILMIVTIFFVLSLMILFPDTFNKPVVAAVIAPFINVYLTK